MNILLILFGLILGRHWRLALPIAAVGWPALLVATGVASIDAGLFGAALVAVINTGIGVLIRQAVSWMVGLTRRG